MVDHSDRDILAIFRLLSPEEIERYIGLEDKSESVPIKKAAGAENITVDNSTPKKEAPSVRALNDSQRPQKASQAFPRDNQAQIIPIHKDIKIDAPSEDAEVTQKSYPEVKKESSLEGYIAEEEDNELAAVGILSANTIKKIEQDQIAKKNAQKDSATIFLLKEREKLKSSQKKLNSYVAFKSYQSSAAQEFYEESDENILDDEKKTELKGILLNKKQF